MDPKNSKIKVLIVDDHALLRYSLARIIGNNVNFVVIGLSANGKEAVEFCKCNDVDVVIMDIEMPEMNGIVATRMISESNRSIKIIGLSMHNESAYVNSMLEAGAVKYLNKSCHPENICSSIIECFNI